MIKKPFFSFGSPKLKYPVILDLQKEIDREIPVPETVTVHLKRPLPSINNDKLKTGAFVRTGQRIFIDNEYNDYFISPATGEIFNISEHIGYLGASCASISIRTDKSEKPDEAFKSLKGAVSSKNAARYLRDLPGCPDFISFINRETPLKTIIIQGIDEDILVKTNQVLLSTRVKEIREGAVLLKEITRAERVIIATSPGLAGIARETGVEVCEIDPVYPNALSQMIIKKALGMEIPANKSCEDMGAGVVRAEAVVALADAFNRGKPPVDKLITVIDKNCASKIISARIGTPVKNILEELNINTGQGDRIIMGGPMTGRSTYSEESPVMADTNAIMVQDAGVIQTNPDIPCLNCGECVRACPAHIPVNMLIRLLENSLYEEAAREYDMLSCIECGLCDYVCVSRIPIVHFIVLGKQEFARLENAEEMNA